MRHELNIFPQFFCRIAEGTKTFEVVDSEAGFQMGDTIVYREFDPTPINPNSDEPKGLTASEPKEFTIGYIQILSATRVVLSLLPMNLLANKKKK